MIAGCPEGETIGFYNVRARILEPLLLSNDLLHAGLDHCLFGPLVADSGQLGGYEASVDGLVVMYAERLHIGSECDTVLLVDDEIGDGRLKVQ